MKTAYWIGAILGVSITLIYLFQERYPDFMNLFSNAFPPFVAGAAMIASVFALMKYWGNLGDRFSKIWIGFSSGMVCWFLGELGWAIYTLILNVEIPYPSIADVVWLIGYIPLFIALFLYVRTFRSATSKLMRIATDIGLFTGSFTLFVFFAAQILVAPVEEGIITLIFDLAYPALDLALLSLSILALLIFAKGKIARAWFFINGAILMTIVGDMLFSYTTLQGTYYNGHFLELFFHWGYILFALGFYTHQKEL